MFEITQRPASRCGPVRNNGDVHGGGQCGTKPFQPRLDPVDRGDDVGARRPVDAQQNRSFAIGDGCRPVVLDQIDDFRHIGKSDRAPVAIGDDETLIVLGLGRLVVGIDLKPPAARLDGALRAVGIRRGDGGTHVLEADPIFGERIGVEFNPHRERSRTENGDVAHALD